MDFEMIEIPQNEVVTQEKGGLTPQSGQKEPMINQENVGRIINIASEIVSIAKSKEQHTFEIGKMEQFRKALREEADVYVDKLRAETNSKISKVEQLRALLNEFYMAHQGMPVDENYKEAIGEITKAFKEALDK